MNHLSTSLVFSGGGWSRFLDLVVDSEIILAAAIFALALLPVAWHVWKTASLPVGMVTCALYLVATASMAWAVMSYRPEVVPEAEHDNRPIQVNEPGFASSKACKSCHPGQYAMWYASYHRSMTQLVAPNTVVGGFDRDVELYGITFHLERRGDEYWIDMPAPASLQFEPSETKTTRRVQRRLIMSTGSHHLQEYWYASGPGRPPNFSPIAYDIAEDKWIPSPDVFLVPQRSRPVRANWNVRCFTCHATHTQAHSRSGKNRTITEFGIACEECHGAGEEHVRKNRNPTYRMLRRLQGESDSTIVHPARLSSERASAICGHCHRVSPRNREEMLAMSLALPGDEPDSFGLPPLNPTMMYSDGMVRSGGREYSAMLSTPCVQAGDMSCLSCHVMHKPPDDPRPVEEWTDDQLKHGMRRNSACLQCHEIRDVADHTHHAPESSGSNCYNCHMPHTSYALRKAIRTHQINIPTVEATTQTGRPNACNQCHLDKTLGWTADHLRTWYGMERPPLSQDEESIAASILWLLRGHAGQRALAAWTMGWDAATEASKTGWKTPYLAMLLADPYPAVRAIAYRSLRKIHGFEDFEYNAAEWNDELQSDVDRALSLWQKLRKNTSRPVSDNAILINEAGTLQGGTFERLFSERDDQKINWLE